MADVVSAEGYLETLMPIMRQVSDQATGPVQAAAEDRKSVV